MTLPVILALCMGGIACCTPLTLYLFWLAQRRWGRNEPSATLAENTVVAAVQSGLAEYWNPESGRGLGAIPQSWTGLALALHDKQDR